MITVVGRWETGWLEPKVEAFMFRQLKNAYKFDRLVMVPRLLEGHIKSVDQFDTMEEALQTTTGTKVFLEPKGHSPFSAVLLHDDLVFILGNANEGNARRAKSGDLVVRIDTPGQTDMFAVNAAAIALDRVHERR